MKSYKFSKTYIAAFMYRFAFLLFVPFLQGLLFARQGVERLFTLYSLDLLVAVFLLSLAVVRWNKGKLLIKDKKISVCQGAVFKTEERSLIFSKGSVLATEGLMLRIFKGSKLRIFSGTAYSTAYLRKKDAEEIFESLTEENEVIRFSSGVFRSLMMSLSFSNALTGLLAAVPVIRKASAVIGARQTALLLEGASLEGILGFTGLPPVLSRLSSLLFLCWVVGFSTEFFREYSLKISVYPSCFKVSKGLMTKTQAIFSKDAVRGLVYKQSLLLFIFGLYSAEASLNIRPRRKIHILSAASRTKCSDLEDVILGDKGKRLAFIAVPKAALWGYTWLPILLLSVSSAIVIGFSENIIVKTVAGVLSGIFSVWFLFRTVALYRSSVSFWKDFIEVRYFSGMNFTRQIFKKEDIVSFEQSRSIFQRFSGRCNLIFKVGNTKAQRVKIKHIRQWDLSSFNM